MKISIIDKRPDNNLSIDEEMLGVAKEEHIEQYHDKVTIVQDRENGFRVIVTMTRAEFLERLKELSAEDDKREAIKKEYHTCPKCGEPIAGSRKVDHFRSAHPEYKFTVDKPYINSTQNRYRCEGCGLTFGSFKTLVEKHTKCIGAQNTV